MATAVDNIVSDKLFEWLLRRGDSALILGHRVSEWCGHSPVLEEDIALANVALDLIGQARLWLTYAGEIEGKGRGENELAFLRDAWDFHNFLLVEQPNGDFGKTLMRQFLYDAYQVLLLEALENSSDQRVAEIAAKAGKEAAYHLDRSADLVIRLGDGTSESHRRMQTALETLWIYTGELFSGDEVDEVVSDAGIAPMPETLQSSWRQIVDEVLTRATLEVPDTTFSHTGGVTGRHSEHLGHLLAEMQFLQRAYPGATW
ncbi:MAG: phenylacetate-CoA oxygenase subunit PaaC [Roseibium sp.]|uniref:1,2-phenylacetyl-CoA epoxidase subunit PaaC n=1 Tax=Roseibium sp. TaxID=1936156 RepID=UPI0026065DF4|nr:1,2-phenylacetyl-CoA epoxidase subunit PaaC [Roseibium sp.]MCV0428847.1 phenylacetate-CoA oxygenase subunit PaaC [Roseibium sp.]